MACGVRDAATQRAGRDGTENRGNHITFVLSRRGRGLPLRDDEGEGAPGGGVALPPYSLTILFVRLHWRDGLGDEEFFGAVAVVTVKVGVPDAG